ncbi:MAG TPA: CtsR family transcriptional regulator [Firmicutes bacterium]|jgi:transcriptional regulator CtsR|nr:CtsR family transcriptional regulator [Bacillota bacterium]
MRTTTDAIELYLKRKIEEHAGGVRFRRNELASRFACTISQISYVLDTRFTIDHGYYVERRRGGGGYIEIRRIALAGDSAEDLYDAIGRELSDAAAARILGRLVDNDIISKRRAEQIYSILRGYATPIPSPWSEYLRACLLKGMLSVLLDNPDEQPGGGGPNDM